MKRIALAVMLGGACTAAFAMEPMPDMDLSDSTGQSGISIDLSPVSVTAQHVRFYDGDGFAGDANAASLDIANLAISTTTNTRFYIDIGSTGTGVTAKTGLLFAIGGISGMSITTGNISTDGGTELKPAANVHNFASFSATNINMSPLELLITAGGHYSNSGLSFSTITPVSSLTASVALTDTIDGGVLSTQFSVSGLDVAGATVDVMSAGQGVQIGVGSTTIGSVSLGDIRVGATAFTGGDIGTVMLRNVNLTGSTLSVVGH